MSTTELTALRSATDTGAVEVRLRHVMAEQGVTLGWFKVSELDRLIRDLMRWGVFDEDGATSSNLKGSASGTFRIDNDAYFEVVVDPEQDD